MSLGVHACLLTYTKQFIFDLVFFLLFIFLLDKLYMIEIDDVFLLKKK